MSSEGERSLSSLIQKGGVYYNISGSKPEEVLGDAVRLMPLPKSLGKEQFLQAIMERERLMPTAVGNGIAIPHPRNPLVGDPADQFVSVCFLDRPVPWRALDGKAVSILIFIGSASAKLHLGILSRVSFLCQDPAFRRLLSERASAEELFQAISRTEALWGQASNDRGD